MTRFAVYLCRLSVLLLVALPAAAGDPVAGKAKTEHQCAECHRPSDWNGETKAGLESLLRDIAAGKITHAKRALHLSAEDISDIAAYWTSAPEKKKK